MTSTHALVSAYWAAVEARDGVGITDFWPEPYEPPANRAHLVERF